MQTFSALGLPFGLACRRLAVSSGSRTKTVAHAKRKGVGKELRELQQLKDNAAPTAVAPPQQPTSPARPPTAATVTTTTTPPATGGAAPAAALSPAAPASQLPVSTAGNASTSSSGSGSGLFDNLLIRILASVTAIMAVISVFYSIVFYGASSAVYIFKDQLAAITKKDFVPYSERRRLEQEVLAKLEAEQAARLAARGDGGSSGQEGSEARTAAAASGEEGPAAGAAADSEDANSSAELLNLLPSSIKKK